MLKSKTLPKISLLISSIFMLNSLHAQSSAVDSETIFSYSNIPDARIRLSITCAAVNKFFSLPGNKSLRLGLSVRNIGLTQKGSERVTGRVFGLGVPISILQLKSNLSFFGVGAHYEYFTDYKEKIYNDPKEVNKQFDMKRINPHQLSVFLEYSPTVRLGLKVGYYFTDFFHTESTGDLSGVWRGIDQSNMMYISLRGSLVCFNCED